MYDHCEKIKISLKNWLSYINWPKQSCFKKEENTKSEKSELMGDVKKLYLLGSPRV